MKKNTVLCLFIAIAGALLSGCLENTLVVDVAKDGSGTITNTMYMSPQMYQQISVDESGQPVEGDPLVNDESKANAEAMAAKFGPNVKFVSLETTSKDDWKGAVATYTFDDVTKLTLDLTSVMEDPNDTEAAPSKTPIKIAFTSGDVSKLELTMPDVGNGKASTEPAPEMTAEEMQQMQMMAMMMQGMQFSMLLKVDGTITETNAGTVDGSTITLFQIDMGTALSNPEGFQSMQASAESDDPQQMLKGLNGVDGVIIESAPKITVDFK